MSVWREVIEAAGDQARAFLGIKRDPCRVLVRKQVRLARAKTRRRPNPRRIARLEAEVAVWEERCECA